MLRKIAYRKPQKEKKKKKKPTEAKVTMMVRKAK